MNKKGQIFIVTTGDYSDYTIDRVFSTRQKATEYLDTKDDNYTLEVFDIDEPIERNTQIYRISFYLDRKKVWRCDTCSDKRYKDLIHIGGRYTINGEMPKFFNNMGTLDIYVESDSRKRALKVASERYGAIIAGEQTMFPYLRVGSIRHFTELKPAYFNFNTGEMVLLDYQEVAIELPSFIKVKRIKKE